MYQAQPLRIHHQRRRQQLPQLRVQLQEPAATLLELRRDGRDLGGHLILVHVLVTQFLIRHSVEPKPHLTNQIAQLLQTHK